ncbi:MAG: FMN-binding protein [Spirochaetaceae bacterium]|nr:MAG: FMN-binding protein [Spirochaetaceae bacterium]
MEGTLKKFLFLVVIVTVAFFAAACGADEQVEAPTPEIAAETADPAVPEGIGNGRYRGIYGDGGEQQVSIQFDVADGVFTNVSFRHLQYRGNSYRNLPEDHQSYPVFAQHLQIAEYLEGRPITDAVDLYNPGNFISDIDGYSGATIRGSKVHSAIQDGLNRGIYSPRNGYTTNLESFPDGRYRGIYGDGGEQQVSIQFDVTNNTFSNVSFRHLQYRGDSYRNLPEDHQSYPVFAQHLQIAEHLNGQPLTAVFDLHSPADFVDDIDGYSGATVRANKVFSAIRDGLNRGLYSPTNGIDREIGSYADGRYRGIYGDGGEQQVSIQFDVTNNTFSNVSFRHLQYRGNSFRNLPEDHQSYPVFAQHLQIAEHLNGQPLTAVFDLHSPADFVDDIDGYSGATVRANKVFSAIRDGLNRGLY